MTDPTRHSRANYICARLAQRIAREAPPGLGAIPEAWEHVDGPSAAFVDALRAFEEGRSSEQAVIEAGQALRRAWLGAQQLS